MRFTKISSNYFHLVEKSLSELGRFYDGHENSKFFSQLINKDKKDQNGYFTIKKELWCAVSDENKYLGFLCLNYKRGGSVKIGPIIVDPDNREKGVGNFLINSSLRKLKLENIRKVYATTSDNNIAANKLFNKNRFKLELELPDQYRKGSKENIWSYFFDYSKEIFIPEKSFLSTSILVSPGHDKVYEFDSNLDLGYLKKTVVIMKNWHNDINPVFMTQIIDATKRGLDFETKGKIILVTRNELTQKTTGLTVATPKRGGPVKIYPICGSSDSQKLLLNELKIIFKNNNYRKLYTFVHANDDAHIQFMIDYGFNLRGSISSPYKTGHDLAVLDLFI